MTTQRPPWDLPEQSGQKQQFDEGQPPAQEAGQYQTYATQPRLSAHGGYPTHTFPVADLGSYPVKPHKKAHRKRNVVLAIVGDLFVISFIAHVGDRNEAPSKRTAAATSKTTAATANRQAATPKRHAATWKAPASRRALAGVSTDRAIVTWFNGGAKADLQTVMADMGQISADAKTENFAAVEHDCVQLASAVTKLQANGPMPDDRAEKWLARALAEWNEGAAQCEAGANSENSEMMVQSADEVNQGTNDLARVTKLVSNLIGP
jgi:hypothetical protein